MKCIKCDIPKDESEFYIKDKKTGRKNKWCKECTLTFQKARWRDRKTKIVELMGGKCEKCGYDKNYAALDLHHTDPSTKKYLLREMIKKSWKIITQEIQKCELLCKNCHAEHHYPQWNKNNVRQHNTYAKAMNERPIYKFASQCPECGNHAFGTTYCSIKCRALSDRKVRVRPSKEELIEMTHTMSVCAIGRKYGVSDNAIRKWMK